MSDFKTLKGLYIKHRSSDPSNLIEGEIWYNTTTQTLKVAPQIGTWATGTSCSDAKRGRLRSFGIQTAAVVAGGFPTVADSEEYNGSSWTAGGDINTAREYVGTSGTLTAGVIFSGRASPDLKDECEEYNGTSWTENGDVNTAVLAPASSTSGPQTATVKFGGEAGGSTASTSTEEYNGTSWTAANNLPAGFYDAQGFGVLTAAVAVGNVNAHYDGTNWTSANALSTDRDGFGTAGLQTAGLAFGGQLPPGKQVLTEAYDGTSWSEHGGNMATGRNELGGCGTSVAGLATCGDRPGTNTDVEEWTDAATARSVDTT